MGRDNDQDVIENYKLIFGEITLYHPKLYLRLHFAP